MKNIINKSIIIIAIFIALLTGKIYSQNIAEGEFMIVNQTSGKNILVKMYPVGAIFSGGGQYTVDAKHSITQNEKYIYGFSLLPKLCLGRQC